MYEPHNTTTRKRHFCGHFQFFNSPRNSTQQKERDENTARFVGSHNDSNNGDNDDDDNNNNNNNSSNSNFCGTPIPSSLPLLGEDEGAGLYIWLSYPAAQPMDSVQ